MPTTPGYADVSLQLKHALVTRPAFITFGIKPTLTDPVAMAASVYTAWSGGTSLKSAIDSNVTIGPTTVRFGVDGEEDHVAVDATTAVGTKGVVSITPNVAVLAVKRSSRGGRRGKGRLYLPWAVTGSMVDESGVIQTAELGSINTTLTIFLNALNTNLVPMYIIHGKGKPTTADPAGLGGLPNLVTSLQAVNLVSTQRRRLARS